MNAILARFQDEPSLVEPSMQATFEACVNHAAETLDKLEAEPMASDDFWFSSDDWRSMYRPYNVKNGVLMIPIKGVLLNNFPWQDGQWATGYEYIQQAMRRGVEDSDVRSIALVINSPGGVVSGNFELADKMYAMRGKKPIKAFAADSAYSAAYSLASTADEISVARSGGVGSIGVVTMHADYSDALKERGIKITFIYAGKHKVDGNPYEPLPDAVRKRMQARIDALYSDFVALVARNRDMDEKDVRATEALTYMATEAVEKGLADEVMSFDDAIAAFTAKVNSNEEETDMAEKDKAHITEEAHAAAVTAAKVEGKAEGVKEGATAAMTRINAIMDSEAGKARPNAALNAALKTSMSAEEASAFLATLPEEKKQEAAAAPANGAGVGAAVFTAAMGNTSNPNIGASEEEKAEKSAIEETSELIKAFGLPGFKS